MEEKEIIRVLAKSKAGSEHMIVGRVQDKQGVPYKSKEEAKAHLTANEWTNIRFVVSRKVAATGMVYTTWDDGSKTEHLNGSGDFQYQNRKAEPKKISKSDLAKETK